MLNAARLKNKAITKNFKFYMCMGFSFVNVLINTNVLTEVTSFSNKKAAQTSRFCDFFAFTKNGAD